MGGNRDATDAGTPDGLDVSLEGSEEALLAEAMCSSFHPLRARDVQSSSALPSFAPPPEGAVLAGRYRVGRALGQGGMGVVLEAQHLLTDKRVAIKCLRGGEAREGIAAARLRREARAAGRINHPNVVAIHDVGIHDGTPFVVMELLEGMSLAQRMSAGPLSVAEALGIMLGIMKGVAAAHAHGILHRDLKPDNVFLCRDGEGRAVIPKVLDFGISRALAQGESLATLTGEGMRIGTPAFMAPEQVQGDQELCERTDVYALAVLLYFMLTRRLPFSADSQRGLLHQIVLQPARSPRELRTELPEALANTVLIALAKEPSQRFPSVAAFADALSPFAGSSSSVAPGALRAVGWRPRPTQVWTISLLTCAGIALVAHGVGLFSRPTPAARPRVGVQAVETSVEARPTRQLPGETQIVYQTPAEPAASATPATSPARPARAPRPAAGRRTKDPEHSVSGAVERSAQALSSPSAATPAAQTRRAGPLSVDDFVLPAPARSPESQGWQPP